jgi:predicted ATPase
MRGRARFVGRDTEIHELRQLFPAGAGVGCGIALLEGEPGIGKTRLSIQFAEECEQGGAIALYSRCDPDSDHPYQPFVDALRDAFGPEVLAEIRARIPAQLSELAGSPPELAHTVGLLPAMHNRAGDIDRDRVSNAIATVLVELSSARPMLLVLDDLHSSNKETLIVLRQIVRAARTAPMLVLGTYRNTERSEDLLKTVAELHREHVVHRISLIGLNEDDAADLIGDVSQQLVPIERCRALWEKCRGNPFFVEEMARHQATTSLEPLPPAVTDVIDQRLAGVSADTRTFLEAASVAGNQFSLDIIERLGELSEIALAASLREAIEARLIDELPGIYGRLAFHQALICQRLYAQLTRTRCARLHQRIGEVLEQLDADEPSRLAELAHHFSLAPPQVGLTKAIKYAVLAARHTLPHEDATHHYAALFARLGPRTGTDQRDELLLALHDAQMRATDIAAARAVLDATGDSTKHRE